MPTRLSLDSIHHFIGWEGLIGYVSMHLTRWIDIDYIHCAHSIAKHTQLPNLLLQRPMNTMLHSTKNDESYIHHNYLAFYLYDLKYFSFKMEDLYYCFLEIKLSFKLSRSTLNMIIKVSIHNIQRKSTRYYQRCVYRTSCPTWVD